MRTLIPFRTAVATMLVVFSLFLIFHVLVIAGVVPQEIVWGGRMSTRAELVQFEIVSIATLPLSAVAVYAYGRRRQAGQRAIVLRILMWILVALFVLNTIGNIFAQTDFERYAFTPVTVILALLALRLAID